MSYDIEYDTKNKSEEEIDAQALKDARGYLDKHWDRYLCAMTRAIAQKTTRNQIAFISGFAGIQGRPVEAVLKYICELTSMDMPMWEEDME